MKILFFVSLLIFIDLTKSFGQHELTDALASRYCTELSQIDTATKSNFEKILPKLDEKIIFDKSGFLPLIVEEVNKQNVTYREFYAGVYNKFSKQCPAYKKLYGVDSSIHLKDPDYFIDSFCNCFSEETGGKIENGDLTQVMENCNEKLGNEREYKKKLRKELKNRNLSREKFSAYITGRFLTGCDLIVNYYFNREAKFLELNTLLMVKKKK